jgi:hypothetical protein
MDTNAAVAAILPERYFITPPPDEFTATIGEFRLDAKSVPYEGNVRRRSVVLISICGEASGWCRTEEANS